MVTTFPVNAATLNTRGDVNTDGIRNTADLIRLKYLFSENNTESASADVNGDGIIDEVDLFSLRSLLVGCSYDSTDRLELYGKNFFSNGNVQLISDETKIGDKMASLTVENTSLKNGWPAIFIPFGEVIDFRNYASFHMDAYFEGIHPWIQIGFMDQDWKRLPGGDSDFHTVSLDMKSDEWCSITVNMDEFYFDDEALRSIGGIIIFINANDNVTLNEDGKSYVAFDNLNFNKTLKTRIDDDLISGQIEKISFTAKEDNQTYWNDITVQTETTCNSNEAILVTGNGYQEIYPHIQLRFEASDWSGFDEINFDVMFRNAKQWCQVKLITLIGGRETLSEASYSNDFRGDGWQNFRVDLTTMLDQTVNLEKVIGIDICVMPNYMPDPSKESQIFFDNIYAYRGTEDTDLIALYINNDTTLNSDTVSYKMQPYETKDSPTALQIYTDTANDNEWPQLSLKFYEPKDLTDIESLRFHIKAVGAHPWIAVKLTDISGNVLGQDVGEDYQADAWEELTISISRFGLTDEQLKQVGGIKINTYFTESAFVPSTDGYASVYIDNLRFIKSEDSQFIYSVSDTETYLRDRFYNMNTSEADTAIKLDTGKNETSSFQLIASPAETVKSYDFIVSDLVSGSNVISSEAFEIFVEKYVLVTQTNESNLLKGWYPDALVPLANICHYGENTIAASDNQGFWFNLKVPKAAASGTYTGTITFVADGRNTELPISVNVYDVTVPEEVHMATSFGINWHTIQYGEGVRANTSEIQQSYYDFLTEQRLASQTLPFWGTMSEYVERIVVMAENPAISTYRLPYEVDEDNNLSETSVKELLTCMAEKNVQLVKEGKNTDLFAKAYFYLASLIDEPTVSMYDKVKEYNAIINDAILETANLLTDELITEYPLLASIKQSLLDLKHVVTTGYSPQLATGTGAVDTWCPLFSAYESESAQFQALKAAGAHVWWYGCIYPTAPYPTYHLDDSLLSSRLLAWMQYDYGIEGNLYWCINHYQYYNSEYRRRNFWKDGLSWENCNGEGMLVYPGLKYGIDGPVSTLRLESIREGQEDYEYLWLFENYIQTYNDASNQNINAKDLLSEYFSGLYDGVQITGTNIQYQNNRKKLLSVLENMQTDLDGTIEKLGKEMEK